MKRLSLSELYAIAAAILLLFLALVNDAWLMLAVSLVGFIAGLIIARKPAAPATTEEPGQGEGKEGMLGSLHRAGVFGLVGFAVAFVFAIIILVRG